MRRAKSVELQERLSTFRDLVFGKLLLNKFLGCELSRVFNCNSGQSKSYAEAYSTAKTCLSLPIDFVHARYTHRFARHFYTPQELSRLFQDWTRSKAIEVSP